MSRFHTAAFLCLAIAAAFALSGCTTTTREPEPVIRTVEVQVPVDNPECARKAMAELGTGILYPDTDAALAASGTLFDRVKLLLAGRELREARETALVSALAECAR